MVGRGHVERCSDVLEVAFASHYRALATTANMIRYDNRQRDRGENSEKEHLQKFLSEMSRSSEHKCRTSLRFR